MTIDFNHLSTLKTPDEKFAYLDKLDGNNDGKIEKNVWLQYQAALGNNNNDPLVALNNTKNANAPEAPKEEKTNVDANNEHKKAVFVVREKRPEFPGGEKELMKTIDKYIKYPQLAQENNIEGIVRVQFTVSKYGGYIKNIKSFAPSYLKEYGLDKEAERVVALLPNFKPGTKDDEPVDVQYTLPIAFRLK